MTNDEKIRLVTHVATEMYSKILPRLLDEYGKLKACEDDLIGLRLSCVADADELVSEVRTRLGIELD